MPASIRRVSGAVRAATTNPTATVMNSEVRVLTEVETISGGAAS